MQTISTILIADDDDGHAFLVENNLRQFGVNACFLRFNDGQETLDFLHGRTEDPRLDPRLPYLLLLDINMPKVDGVSVLREVKASKILGKLPIIMLTTTDDPREVDRCHELGCAAYLQKPGSFDDFAAAVAKLGMFISLTGAPAR